MNENPDLKVTLPNEASEELLDSLFWKYHGIGPIYFPIKFINANIPAFANGFFAFKKN